MRRNRRLPSDYPQYAFRLYSKEEKAELETAIDAAVAALNKELKDHQRKYSKSEVIVTAMKEGLELIRRKKVRPPD